MLYETAEAVATVTLNRPERLNALTPELVGDMRDALIQAIEDDHVRVIRLRGGGSSFCAGYDIGWGAADHGGARGGAAVGPDGRPADHVAGSWTLYMAIWRSPKPVIAQVHGYCVGGGTDFALCSDLIVCADDCRIGYPPARVWGSPTTAMWMYRLGLERSKRLLLTGDAIDGTPRRGVGAGERERSRRRARRGRPGARAARGAAARATRRQMMKVLVNQAFEAMGLHTTQLIGTLLDGAARHTPEGTALHAARPRRRPRAVRERDTPFGDYGEGPRTA